MSRRRLRFGIARHKHARRTPPGAPPGTLVSDPESPKPTISIFQYNSETLNERKNVALADIRPSDEDGGVTWINVDGLGDAEVVRRLGELFDLHRLALEDVLNTCQRPKVDSYERHLFIVAYVPARDRTSTMEQLSIFLGRNFVVTFQEGHPGDPFDPVRDRIRKHPAFRSHGADYLAYALLDAAVDGYFPILEALGDRLDELDEEIIHRPMRETVRKIHDEKRSLIVLRRNLWPMREALNSLIRDHNPLVSDETRLHLRDCYDHVVRVLDFVETYREICADLMDLYLSSLSQRLNQVMKVLTIISTIFIPLTFITSIYGMNFDTQASEWNMPELRSPWGYPVVLLIMILSGLLMLYSFWRAGWIFEKAEPRHHAEAPTGNPPPAPNTMANPPRRPAPP